MKSYYRLLLLGCTLLSSPALSCENNDPDLFKKPVKPSQKLSEFAQTLLLKKPDDVENYCWQCARTGEAAFLDNITIFKIELEKIKKKSEITDLPLKRLQDIYKIAEKVANSLR